MFSDRNNPDRLFNLILASPSEKFVNEISYQLQKIIEYELPIEIGSLFELNGFTIVRNNNLFFPLRIITGSPIIVRIRPSKFMDEPINSPSILPSYTSVYWRSSHPINLFIDALESNLKKKYFEFTGKSVTGRIFDQFEFRKQVSTKVMVDDHKLVIIGTLWQFTFSISTVKDLQLFALESGLGERNSLGFGFINPLNTKTT